MKATEKIRIRFGGYIHERSGKRIYKVTIGTATYHSSDLDSLRARVLGHKEIDINPALAGYGQGRYMGD